MTKELQIKGGDVSLVDDEDYDLLSRFNWQKAGGPGYAVTTIEFTDGSNRTVYLHRLVMGGFCRIDHKNLNVLDCRKENLRRATMQENGWNKGKPKKCRHGEPTSKYKGVSYCPIRGRDRWAALIKYVKKGEHKSTGKVLRLGYFWDEREAALAYDRKVLELRGEWAWTNILGKNKIEI